MTRRIDRQRVGTRPGISLVEVLVVLIILGILAGTVAPAFRNEVVIDDRETATREIRQTVERARRTAIDRGAPVKLILDAAGARYWVVAARVGADSIVAAGSIPLPPGFHLQSAAPRVAVRFAPTGELSHGDAIVLYGSGGATVITRAGWKGGVTRNAR